MDGQMELEYKFEDTVFYCVLSIYAYFDTFTTYVSD